jgi:hypothetical protein
LQRSIIEQKLHPIRFRSTIVLGLRQGQLDRTDVRVTGSAMSDRLMSLDQKRTSLTPGTVLVREWDRQSHRVMVLADGFAWNGQTFDSLTKVAFAITGTKWNGPRFFGLRNKDDRSNAEYRS